MAESQFVAGRWTLPTVESVGGGAVRMHVSVSVPEVGALGDIPIEASMVAGGQQLTLSASSAPADYYYLQTVGVTAVADFAFDNPDGLTPETVTVSIQGESATFAVGMPGEDPGPLVA